MGLRCSWAERFAPVDDLAVRWYDDIDRGGARSRAVPAERRAIARARSQNDRVVWRC